MQTRKRAFTLIELLVVIAIIAVLAAILFPVFASARAAAKKTACVSNLRQLGYGIRMYADDWDGGMPESSHTAGLEPDRCWVFTLKPYLKNCDEVRTCPNDPKRTSRLAANGTSYLLNEYLVVPGEGEYLNLDSLPRQSETFLSFTISDRQGVSWTQDHTHSRNWFREPRALTWNRILADIQPDRHRMGAPTSPNTEGGDNYLFADTHVKYFPAAKLKGYADSFDNFALPPQ